MSKTVVIHFGSGHLRDGFPDVTVRLWDEHYAAAEQVVGSLPAAPVLAESHQIWQSTYRALCDRQMLRSGTDGAESILELEIAEGGITHVSQVSFQSLSQQLHQQMNTWLQSHQFLNIERYLRSQLHPDAEIRVIFETDDPLLQRLPWHCWDFFRDYAHAEVALSCLEYKRRGGLRSRTTRTSVRILAILGHSQGIDVELERQILQDLPDAETHFLVNPARQEVDRQLWDPSGWDILFFAGHSQTEAGGGRIYINENPIHNSLTIEQLREALSAAIDRGLKLAIFNSCNGVGLAQALGELHILNIIVMREPVPNQVAQEFFKYFLEAYALERLPLYSAVRQARRRLQGLEDDFPAASWLPVLCQNPAVDSPTWLQLGGLPPCPYRGLFAFQEEDAPFFLGREQFTRGLVEGVKHKPCVAIVGPSGSGKSSVVFAGLVAHLRLHAYPSSPSIISFRPGMNPFDALAEAFVKECPEMGATQNPPLLEVQSRRFKTLELAVELQQDRFSLCRIVKAWVQRQSGSHIYLIADQFEELYTLCSETDRQPFLESLLNTVQGAPAFTLVLTLRADFYGHALSDRRFSDILQNSVYNLGPMSQEELQRAIVQPAAQMQVTLENGLAEQLIQATWGHAGRLPLLEFALAQLWAKQQSGKLTHQAYTEIGGVEQAIAHHAEAVYAELEEGDRLRMQKILVQLVQPGAGIEPSRRLAMRDEVGEANWDLVTRLASARLVVTNRHEVTGEETVEIVHESLLRNWRRLEQWLEIDREFRHWQEDLRIARYQWENSGQDEEALLRGKRLIDAKYWYASRDGDLSARDRQFIQLSVSVQEREDRQRKMRRNVITSGLTAGLATALALGGLALWGWQQSILSEVIAISANSDSLFMANQRLEALVAAIRAKQKLRTLFGSDQDAQEYAEQALRQAVSRVDEKNRLLAHDSDTTSVVFSADGQLIVSASTDRTVKLWKPDGSLMATLRGHEDEIWGVAIRPDGQLIASASDDGTVKLWNRDGFLITTLKGHRDGVHAVTFSPDGQQIASASRDGTIKLWNRDGSLRATLQGHGGAIYAVAFSPDGRRIATASRDTTVRLWDLDGKNLKTLSGHTAEVRGVSFSPDGQLIASSSSDQTIKLWRSDGTFLSTLAGHGNQVYQAIFSPDSQLIASASNDKTVRLWSRSGTFLKTYGGHSDGVMGVAFSPDGQTIASASLDNTVRLWSLKPPFLITLNGHQELVWSLAFSPDGQLVASASRDRTIKLWQRDGTFKATLRGHRDAVYDVAFSPNGQMLVSASRDNTIKLWTRDGSLLKTLQGHGNWVNRIRFSPDGGLIASASADGTIKLWRTEGVLQSTLKGHMGGVNGVAFSPDGQLIASASKDRTIRLWSQGGAYLRTLQGHTGEVNAVIFSPDGQLIASASDDKTVTLWTLAGTPLSTLKGHQEAVLRVTFSPDGQLLASTSIDKTVKLWKRDGTLLATLKGYQENVIGVSFSPDGQLLGVTSGDKTVTLWDVENILNTEILLVGGCDWLQDYLRTNPGVKESDRQLCNEVD